MVEIESKTKTLFTLSNPHYHSPSSGLVVLRDKPSFSFSHCHTTQVTPPCSLTVFRQIRWNPQLPVPLPTTHRSLHPLPLPLPPPPLLHPHHHRPGPLLPRHHQTRLPPRPLPQHGRRHASLPRQRRPRRLLLTRSPPRRPVPHWLRRYTLRRHLRLCPRRRLRRHLRRALLRRSRALR